MAFRQHHQALRRTLPRHRAEPDDIAAPARPLMPPHAQPARIDRPHPPLWPLPVRRNTSGHGSLSSFNRAAQTAAIRASSSRSAVASCAWSASAASRPA